MTQGLGQGHRSIPLDHRLDLGFLESATSPLPAFRIRRHLAAFLIEEHPVARRGASPVLRIFRIVEGFAQHPAEAVARPLASPPARDGLGVTAPAVVLRIRDESGPDRVEVDVGGDREQGALVVFDEDALESPFPKRPGAVEALVHVEGEAHFQLLEEAGKIPAASFVAGEDLAVPGLVSRESGAFQFLPDAFDRLAVVEQR